MIDENILNTSGIVLVMTSDHKEEINLKFPGYENKVFLLSEYTEGAKTDIPDPIGMGKDAYRESFRIIKYYTQELIERLKNESKR